MIVGAFEPKMPKKSGVFYKKKVLNPKKYLKVLFGKSGTYKSKYTLKPLLSLNMVHFT